MQDTTQPVYLPLDAAVRLYGSDAVESIALEEDGAPMATTTQPTLNEEHAAHRAREAAARNAPRNRARSAGVLTPSAHGSAASTARRSCRARRRRRTTSDASQP